MDRLREACFQIFIDHLHLPFPFLKIPLHLKKMVIQDMETEFGEGWSVRKVQKEMSKNCKRFWCNQSKKIKKLHPDERYRKRPMDIPVKVWKELVRNYENSDAQRKAGNESIQVLYFPFKINLNL